MQNAISSRVSGRVRSHALLGTALTLFLVAAPAAPVLAQTANWTGATGSWFTAGNWNTSVPTTGDTVTVTNGGTAQINAAAGTIRSLNLSGGSTVDLQTGGSLSTQSGFATTLGDGTGTASNATLLLSGSSAITNTIQFNTGTLSSLVTGTFSSVVTFAGTAAGTGNLITTAAGTTLTLDGNFAVTTGGVTIGGAGTTIIASNTFYTGNTNINSGATFQLGNGGSFGTIYSTDMVNNGTLAVNLAAGASINIFTNISGTGGLTLTSANAETVALTGTNSYSGLTDIQGGSLTLNNLPGISANTTFNVGASGLLRITSINPTLKEITGSGTVLINKIGPGSPQTLSLNGANFTGTVTEASVPGQQLTAASGTSILAGTNSWTGATTINSGATLQFGNGGTGGNIPTGTITNNGTMGINRSDAVTYTGVIGGTGALVKSGTGTLTLTNTNTYGGGTTVAGGTLSLGVSGAAGTGAITTTGSVIDYANGINVANAIVINSTTTQLQTLAGVTATQTGVISETGGARPLEKIGTGTLILAGINTYTGATTISAGTLRAGIANGLASSSAFTVATGATLDLNGNTNTIGSLAGGGSVTLGAGNLVTGGNNTGTTFSGVILGGGALQQNGVGPLILTGTNTYTGGTTISVGTLQLGNGGTTGSIVGNVVVNGAALAFNRSNSDTFAGNISGTGAVTVSGGGTIILTGTNTHATSTNINGASTLQIGDAGTTGSIASTVNVGAGSTLRFSRSDSVTFDQTIAGDGNLTNVGGQLTLTGFNVYTGTTTITGGALHVGAGGTTGNLGTGNVINTGGLVFNRSDAMTYAGVISGTGAVSQMGGGTTTLTGASTYTGGTTITAGTLRLGTGGSLATTGAMAVNGGSLDLNGNSQTVAALSGTGGTILLGAGTLTTSNASNATLASVVSGTGGMTKAGTGTLILTGTNTYTGTTTITAGTLQVGAGGTAGSIAGNVANSGTVAFNRSDSVTYAGIISGTGALTQSGTGTTILTGANTHTGGTTITAGTLQVGAGGTAGSIAGNVANSGTVAFNRSDSVTYAGVVSGTGVLTQSGTGTTILTGANTYTGGTTITAGTLQVGAGGTVGSLTGNIANGGTLAFNRSDAFAYAGVISGTGGMTKLAANTLTLTGTNTYTGATSVSAGTLMVNGSIGSSPVTVASGATLGGTGTVGATTVQASGTLSPGNSIGTLNVNGNLTFAANSVYTMEISPTAADLTVVSGAASLNGTLALAPAAGVYTAGTSLTLLTAGSINGTFGAVTGLNFPGLTSQIVYSATNVRLVLSSVAVVVPPLPPAPVVVTFTGRTPNQIAAAAALNAAPSGGGLRTALTTYLTANPSQMEAVLDSLSGEIHASLRSAALEDSRLIRNTVQGQLARKPQGTHVWGQGFADYGSLDSDGNAGEARRNNAGFIAGVDTQVAEGLRLGIGGAFMEHKLGVNVRGSRAIGSRGSLLAYASYTSDALTLSLGGDYGWGSDDISRSIAALGETQVSTRDSDAGGFFARVSYDFGLPVLPYAGIVHASATNGAFTETGGLAALSGGAVSDSQTYSLLGFSLALEALDFNGMALTPRADIAWSHALDVMAPAQSVALATGQGFMVLGTPIGSDVAAIQLGLDLQLAPQALFTVGYDGLLSATGTSHAIRGGLNWQF